MTADFEQRRVKLSTGVELDVVDMGPRDAPALIFLHGFPESHRTWREVAPRLEDSFRLIMPDQRGFAGSDRPLDVAEYETDTLIGDIFALADTLGLESFALVGHDWGGAIAWPAALRWMGNGTSGGTSSPRAATGSTRRSGHGEPVSSRFHPTTTTSSSRCRRSR